jgi:hypothetical protein
MKRLAAAGSTHSKYRRMLPVWVTITAPLYWWKEYDTYKVGTVANSCSTMHKITERDLTIDDFSHEHLFDDWEDKEALIDYNDGEYLNTARDVLEWVVYALNRYRRIYIETKTKPMKNEDARKELLKRYWWQIIQLLPSSYNQKRTLMLNYEVLAAIYRDRKNHKLDEWHTFCDWIESLPHSDIIIGEVSK